MAWTKLDIIREAYSEIGKADYEFDLHPEDLQTGLRRLDGMMASWGGLFGVRIGYSGGDGMGDVNASAEVPDWAVEALYLNLAIRIAPSFGKTVSAETRAAAKQALDGVMRRTVPHTPRSFAGSYGGAGRGSYAQLPQDAPRIITGDDGFTIIGGGA